MVDIRVYSGRYSFLVFMCIPAGTPHWYSCVAEQVLTLIISICVHFVCLQVSDFGLASEANTTQTSRMFPIKWTAPEALRDSVRSKVSPLFIHCPLLHSWVLRPHRFFHRCSWFCTWYLLITSMRCYVCVRYFPVLLLLNYGVELPSKMEKYRLTYGWIWVISTTEV